MNLCKCVLSFVFLRCNCVRCICQWQLKSYLILSECGVHCGKASSVNEPWVSGWRKNRSSEWHHRPTQHLHQSLLPINAGSPSNGCVSGCVVCLWVCVSGSALEVKGRQTRWRRECRSRGRCQRDSRRRWTCRAAWPTTASAAAPPRTWSSSMSPRPLDARCCHYTSTDLSIKLYHQTPSTLDWLSRPVCSA